MANDLTFSDAPLSAEQGNQLAEILERDRYDPVKTNATGTDTMMGGTPVPEDAIRRLRAAQPSGTQVAIITDASILDAEATLPPSQVSALKTLQQLQLARIQLAPSTPTPPSGR